MHMYRCYLLASKQNVGTTKTKLLKSEKLASPGKGSSSAARVLDLLQVNEEKHSLDS